jgi:hypothetical protein
LTNHHLGIAVKTGMKERGSYLKMLIDFLSFSIFKNVDALICFLFNQPVN